MFDAFTGNIYLANDRYASGRSKWELHHIDHLKTNNNPRNLLWAYKAVDPSTGSTSHKTVFSTENELREYIALGRIISISLRHNFAPKCWSSINQMRFYQIMKNQPRRLI